ncbi:hypothetical protein HDE69_000448 [Pedobacter cryoconitis]|uniref:DUF4932 domain-containing protein n=1 Tax=Pedobacter cryoconitis TaxID=188932 RepID=A0A7W8YPQ5_9SPHI|nr:DUF4932 domain-containing protein [Pedobacter cryoconitis]MBB5619412.1 hypothetical protein [Pedobacter cryoconitis]
MKLTITFLLVLINTFSFAKPPVFSRPVPVFNKTQAVTSTVDRRVELLSIVFRLAGNPEYNMNFAKQYVKDINAYFGKYKDQPIISFAKKLSEEKGMGFSRVMFLAANLEFKGDQFSLIKVSKSSLAGKWEMEDALKFVKLLNDFYKTSSFEVFYKNHQSIYNVATTRFNQASASFDPNWYPAYYGDHSVDYKTVVGLANVGANYGPSVFPAGQKKIVYAIMGSWTFDETSQPLFSANDYLPTLIHEFNHSFVNHILEEDGNGKLLEASGGILLDSQRIEMKREAYEDWQSLINESLVRACVVRYLIDHKNEDKVVQAEILEQQKKGFLWTKELVMLLGEYESSRDRYPTFKSFYPRIITFFDQTAGNIKEIKAAYHAKQ